MIVNQTTNEINDKETYRNCVITSFTPHIVRGAQFINCSFRFNIGITPNDPLGLARIYDSTFINCNFQDVKIQMLNGLFENCRFQSINSMLWDMRDKRNFVGCRAFSVTGIASEFEPIPGLSVENTVFFSKKLLRMALDREERNLGVHPIQFIAQKWLKEYKIHHDSNFIYATKIHVKLSFHRQLEIYNDLPSIPRKTEDVNEYDFIRFLVCRGVIERHDIGWKKLTSWRILSVNDRTIAISYNSEWDTEVAAQSDAVIRLCEGLYKVVKNRYGPNSSHDTLQKAIESIISA